MLNFKLKSSILLTALTSITLQAQDYTVTDTVALQAQSEVVESQPSEPEKLTASDSESTTTTQTSSPMCPADFFSLPLYPNAKFCQLFDHGLPASMSYFAISNQQSAKDFYISQMGQAEQEKMLNGRIVLQYSNGQQIVVISKDGQGSQIDILIKSAG
ncbi:hypothetical protein [Paraglaciecola arctica]|uniref:hypothetical protein n=1 Tax=Paraglaciecola arctica TaxID=1128911 RepID=UPI0020905F4D|nr:hypothetical protein [Paraglaciecola arctica]